MNVLYFLSRSPTISIPHQGLWQQGAWGTLTPKALASPHQHLHIYASSAFHNIWDLFLILFLGGDVIRIVGKDSWALLTFVTLNVLAPTCNFFLAPSLSFTVLSKSIIQLLLINCPHTITIFCQKRIVGTEVHSERIESHINGFPSNLETLTKVL